MYNQLVNFISRHRWYNCGHFGFGKARRPAHFGLLHHKLDKFSNRWSQLLRSDRKAVDMQVVCSKQFFFVAPDKRVNHGLLYWTVWSAKCCWRFDVGCHGRIHNFQCFGNEVHKSQILDFQLCRKFNDLCLSILYVRMWNIVNCQWQMGDLPESILRSYTDFVCVLFANYIDGDYRQQQSTMQTAQVNLFEVHNMREDGRRIGAQQVR